MLERQRLSPTLEVTRVITGLWQIADMERHGEKLEPSQAAEAMRPYVEAGLTSFDMADHYGSAEDIAGVFRQQSPQPVELLTKWVPAPGKVSRADVRRAVERALQRLRSERLELLQFHAWNYADPSWLDALFYLQELRDEGLIGALGLTNFDTAHLRIALTSGLDIACNQVCYSLLDHRPSQGLAALCQQYGVKLLAYGTLAGGLLSERWLGQAEPGLEGLETWSQMKYYRFIQAAGGWQAYQQLLQALQTVAQRQGVPIANVASRYILEQPAVGAVIIGARLGQRAHIAETLQLFNLKLEPENKTLLEQALEQLQPLPGDSGDEYRQSPYLTASGDLSHHLEEFPPPYTVQQQANGRTQALSGTAWESLAGYSRAVRQGSRILVSGTTATHGARVLGDGDPEAQTHAVIDKIAGALQSLGGRLENVVRTRVYIARLEDWEVVARAHGQRFAHIMPANTLIQAQLVGAEYLVEIEAEALLS